MCGSREKEEERRRVLSQQCYKVVNNKEDGLRCDSCQGWNHRECDKMEKKLYRELGEEQSYVMALLGVQKS